MATEKKSPKKKSSGKKMDRKLVASKQSYEVSYLTKMTGKSAAEVKKAIAAKGHSRVKVTAALGGKKSEKKK